MKLTERLNTYLADQMVMYIKLHNLHWYVTGRGFFKLHEKFEELYDETAKIIDDIAERILALGEKPVANMKKALELTNTKELTDDFIEADDAIRALKKDVEYWIRDTKAIIELAETEHDVVTADIFTGYLTEYEKLLWMLRAYIA